MTDTDNAPCAAGCGRAGDYARGLCYRCHYAAKKSGHLTEYATRRQEREPGPRPERTCPWCARPHRSPREECTACRHLEDGLDQVPSPDDALTGGTWAVVHGVRRWTPDTGRQAA